MGRLYKLLLFAEKPPEKLEVYSLLLLGLSATRNLPKKFDLHVGSFRGRYNKLWDP